MIFALWMTEGTLAERWFPPILPAILSRITSSVSHPRCHRKMITSLSWYPLDTGLFISSSVDKYVNVVVSPFLHDQVWDANAFEIVSHMRFKSPVSDAQMPVSGSFSHKMAAVCSGIDGVTLVDLFAGTYAQTIRGTRGVGVCCCWNPQCWLDVSSET